MAEDKDALVPEIRFNGFDDDWEQRKFSDLIDRLVGGASIEPNDYCDDGVRTIPKGAVNPSGVANLSTSKVISKDFFLKNKGSEVKTNDLVTSLRDLVPTAPNMGRIVKIVGENESFLMPQGVYKLGLNINTDEQFLIAFSNCEKYRTIIQAEKIGSTQVHIRNGEFLNINITAPTTPEQISVGNFFHILDDTITLHKNKLNGLKELKNGYMQQMFPQVDENMPRVRFAGFVEPWKQRKLEEVAPLQRGFDLPKSEMIDGEYPVVMSNGINGYHAEFKAKAPGVVTGRSGTIGNLHYIETDYWPHNTTLWVTSFKSNYPRYIYYLYDKIDLSRFGTGTGVPTLNRNDVHNEIVSIPCVDEQIIISNFFRNFDEQIAAQQTKLDKLRRLKVAYLQKMFV